MTAVIVTVSMPSSVVVIIESVGGSAVQSARAGLLLTLTDSPNHLAPALEHHALHTTRATKKSVRIVIHGCDDGVKERRSW